MKFLIRSLLLVLPATAAAQSGLPTCPGTNVTSTWTNCQGAITYTTGTRYVGEFLDGKHHGEGIHYAGKGSGQISGRWENGVIVQFYAIDTDRFPFNQTIQNAAPSAQPDTSEKDRVTTDVRSVLPQCPPLGLKNNCFGSVIYQSGNKYVGEFQRNRQQGLGVLYFSTGQVLRSGLWEEGITVKHIPLTDDRFAFKDQMERRFTVLLDTSLPGSTWRERLNQIVLVELKDWLNPDAKGLEEVVPPVYPAALSLKQEAWETNQEFDARVESNRVERSRTIDQIQAEYRARVKDRNQRAFEYHKLRQEREAKISERRRELILMGASRFPPRVIITEVIVDQQTGGLNITTQIDGFGKQVFAFNETPQAFRRSVLTELKTIKAVPDFQVSDSGDLTVEQITVESGGFSARGTPTSGGSSPVQLASVTLSSTPIPTGLITQQSAVTVDRNHVEQILYRDENESLRKRLEEQRKQQEQALAAAEVRAAAEIARIRAEAEAQRKQLAEARPMQNLASVRDAHALVIGNSAYPGSNRLDNPMNDARAMAVKLRSLGFKVTEVNNASREQMVGGLSEFSKSAARADLTLLFYAGHGAQIQGVNYMVPVDMSLSDPSRATLQAVSLTQVVEQYLPGKTKLVFLDACRDNPLMNSGARGVTRGLAPINVSEGTLISYATKDGQTAEDGTGQTNSPFTAALLEHLADPEDIGIILRTVRSKVMQRTDNRQQPWEYGSLTGGALVLSQIKPR